MARKTFKYKEKNLYKEQIAHLKGYYIDKDGNIFYNGNLRKPIFNKSGYKLISIRINGKPSAIKYHRLQAYQKYGDKIYKKGIEVRHLDNNPGNNSFENIAIGTKTQNFHDSSIETIQKRAQAGGDANRIHDHQEIIKMHNLGMSYKEIMNATGINSKGTISYIIKKSTQSKRM